VRFGPFSAGRPENETPAEGGWRGVPSWSLIRAGARRAGPCSGSDQAAGRPFHAAAARAAAGTAVGPFCSGRSLVSLPTLGRDRRSPQDKNAFTRGTVAGRWALPDDSFGPFPVHAVLQLLDRAHPSFISRVGCRMAAFTLNLCWPSILRILLWYMQLNDRIYQWPGRVSCRRYAHSMMPAVKAKDPPRGEDACGGPLLHRRRDATAVHSTRQASRGYG
jgi:hypothetical protein